MNKSETKAYNWLKSQGHTDINFSPRRTPDFMTSTGESFEVKRRYGNTVWFTKGQMEKIHESNATVLVMENGNDEPTVQISANSVSDGAIHGDIRMTVPAHQYNTIKRTFYLEPETAQRLDNLIATHYTNPTTGSTYGAHSTVVGAAINSYIAYMKSGGNKE